MPKPRATCLVAALLLATLVRTAPARAEQQGASDGVNESGAAPQDATELPPEEAAAPPPKKPARGSVSEEIGTQQPQSSPANPAGASYDENLSGVISLTENWSIQLGALLTLQEGAPRPTGSNFATSGGKVSLFSLGADWDSGEHWSLGVSGSGSPSSSSQTSTSVDLNSVVWAARIASTSSNLEAQLNAAYDTNGDSNAEWLFAGSATYGHLDTDQRIDAVENPVTMKTRTPAELRAACAAYPKLCRKALLEALAPQDDQLDSLKLNLGATLTLFDDTDLTLLGDGYLYAQDPSLVGYFNVAKGGRSASGGDGVPIAPLRYDGRVEALHRFGALSIKLWASAGEYAVPADGITYSFGGKVQYKFSKSFRVWLSGDLQHDVDDTGDDVLTWGASLGAQLRF